MGRHQLHLPNYRKRGSNHKYYGVKIRKKLKCKSFDYNLGDETSWFESYAVLKSAMNQAARNMQALSALKAWMTWKFALHSTS